MARLALLGLVLALAASCSKPEAATKSNDGQDKAPPAAKVALGAVEAGGIDDQWSFLGQVEPLQAVQLASAVDGHVQRVTVREGDRVKRGQSLVLLDAQTFRAELDASEAREAQLEAELAQAKRDAERAAKIQGPAISKPERERLQTRAQSLDAQLRAQKAETARIRTVIGRHNLRAPFDGVVRSRQVDPGAWVDSGKAVLELLSLDELEVLVEVSQALAPHVQSGSKATLHADTGDGKVEAEVVGVVSALDPTTRTMRVRLRPSERPPWLLAGMAVNVAFPVSLAGQGVTVPRDALVRGPVKIRVVKAEGGVGKSVEVQVIATSKGKALVTSDELKAGDKVVVRGNERIRPGQPLEVGE